MADHVRRDDSVLAPAVDLQAPPANAQARPGEHAPLPDLHEFTEKLDDVKLRSIGITGLFVLGLFYTLYLARGFFLPIVFAVLLKLLFSPAVRAMERLRLPTPLGAGIVVLTLAGALGFGVYRAIEPAQAWVAKAPETLSGVGAKLRKLRRPVEQVTRTAEQVAQATEVAPATRTPAVVVKGPTLTERAFGNAQSLVTGALEVFVLLYFLLAVGDLFLQKLIKVLPLLQDKKTAVQIARETEASVSTYLFTVTLVNLGEGAVVAAVMWLLGMPNPVLWGVLVALLEYVPYLGAATMVGVLALAGLTTFEAPGRALLAPACFLAINFVQANFVSPYLLGRRLTLNPVAILIGIIFWWRLWGVPGAFIAVPLIACFKIFCDHIESLAPVGEFLGK